MKAWEALGGGDHCCLLCVLNPSYQVPGTVLYDVCSGPALRSALKAVYTQLVRLGSILCYYAVATWISKFDEHSNVISDFTLKVMHLCNDTACCCAAATLTAYQVLSVEEYTVSAIINVIPCTNIR